MANITGTTYVDAPEIVQSQVGLLTAASVTTANAHELMGYTYEYDASLSVDFVGDDVFACAASAEKEFEEGLDYVESLDPFYVLRGVSCKPVGAGGMPEFLARAERSLELGEEFAVEKHFWDVLLPAMATRVGTGAYKPKQALGLLLEWMGQRYAGTPLLHAGLFVSTYLASEMLVETDVAGAASAGGARLVQGKGYFGLNGLLDEDDEPIVASATQRWMYISGAVMLRRGEVESHPATDYTHNDIFALAERVYVPSIATPVGAILVDVS